MNHQSRTLQLAVAILIACAVSIPLMTSAQSQRPIGSEWVYDFGDEFQGISLTGTYTYSAARITNASLGGEIWEAVEYRSVLSASASGTAEGTTYSGVWLESGSEYYDVATDEIIGYTSDRYLHMRMQFGNATLETTSSEHNETVYTPPGGYGIEPTSMTPGIHWTKTYAKHSNASGLNDGKYFGGESDYSETVEYAYVGTETVIVPAGTFECSKFTATSTDGVLETEWYAAELSGYAKIVDVFRSGETTTYELKSYDLHEGNGGQPVEMASDLFRAVFFILIGATALAALFAAMIVRRRPPTAQTLGGQVFPFPAQQSLRGPNQSRII